MSAVELAAWKQAVAEICTGQNQECCGRPTDDADRVAVRVAEILSAQPFIDKCARERVNAGEKNVAQYCPLCQMGPCNNPGESP